jgi:hypothetical protein
MGKIGCNNDGNLDNTKFSQPMPWIGIYVVAASLACLVGMAADAIHGIRNRKFWFPCKFSSLNATSLTLLAVAIMLGMVTPLNQWLSKLHKIIMESKRSAHSIYVVSAVCLHPRD